MLGIRSLTELSIEVSFGEGFSARVDVQEGVGMSLQSTAPHVCHQHHATHIRRRGMQPGAGEAV